MSTDANTAGFLLYLCLIFAPGLGFGEALNLWGSKESSLVMRIGLALGIGLCFDTAVLAIRTLGITVGGIALKGIDYGTLYFIIAAGLIALVGSILIRRRFLLPIRPRLSDVGVLTIIAILAVLVELFFVKYPIFPEYVRHDFEVHVILVEGLISGSTVTVPRGILYFGVHYQLASALLFVGGEPLVTVQQTMGLLVILSPLLVYVMGVRIFSSVSAGLAIVAVYVLSGSVWFVSVFNSGLYANFFGLLISVFFVVAFLEVSENLRSPRRWLFFMLVAFAAYFSHYTIITIIPALLAVPAVELLRRRPNSLRFLPPMVVMLAPGLVVLLVRPRIVHFLLAFVETAGAAVGGSTTLSAALSSVPALSYIALEINDDVAFVFLFILAAVYVFRAIKLRNALMFIPIVWMAALLIAAPQSVSAWRYSYEAILPLVIMAGYGAYSLLPKPKIQKRRTGESNALSQYSKLGLILLLIISPVVVGSWTTSLVSDATTNTEAQAQSQQNIYSAMMWLKANTPTNATYLSVTDWRFLYTYLIFGRNSTYQYFSTEDEAVNYSQHEGVRYLIVTYVTTLALPIPSDEYPWYTFVPSANATLVYSNPDVKVFQVGTNG